MKCINGKAIANQLRLALKESIEKEKEKPGLAVVIVGNDPASQIYVRNKIKACAEIGIQSYCYTLSEDATQEEVEGVLDQLAVDDKVDGILLQLPLPKHLDGGRATLHIPFEKDVDGFSSWNMGLLLQGKQEIAPCTPSGIIKLLEWEGVELSGKHAVVIGRSETVGKPMALLLLQANATVTVCHSKTTNLKELCQQADILISAVGKSGFVTADMVKEGAVVIDVGMNRNAEGKLCGDVDFEGVKEKTSFITPVPGGVGPMTITMLLYNTYVRFKRK